MPTRKAPAKKTARRSTRKSSGKKLLSGSLKFSRQSLGLIVILLAVIGVVAVAASHAATPVSCSTGTLHYCNFNLPASVRNSSNSQVGTFYRSSSNYVYCQARGATAHRVYGSLTAYNYYWAFTQSDQGAWGWVNAVDAKTGTNYGPYGNVPTCSPSGTYGGHHPGYAPGQGVTHTPTPAPHTPTPPPVGSTGYTNPLRGGRFVSQRIDQGIDFGGTGNVYAIGNGVVVNTYNGGWPGGTFIVYRLTSGSAAGHYVYVAEDCSRHVSSGQSVNSGTVLCYAYGGGDGIEVGWADPRNNAESISHDTYHQHYDGFATAYGQNFSALLHRLGAPSGTLSRSSGHETRSIPYGCNPGLSSTQCSMPRW